MSQSTDEHFFPRTDANGVNSALFRYLLRSVNPTGEKGLWSETASVTIGA